MCGSISVAPGRSRVWGAYMAMQGVDVTFVDRWSEHLCTIREHRLIIGRMRGRRQLTVRALLTDELREPIDLAFVAVKSQHTVGTLAAMRPYLTPTATAVSLQNGFNAVT